MPDEIALMRLVLNTLSLPIIVVDTDLRMVYCNQALSRWNAEFSWKADDLIGKPMLEVFSFLPDRVKENYRTVMETRQPLRSESSYDFGGKQLDVEVELLPILSSDKVTHIITLLRNVTSQRETQLALQQSEERFRRQFMALPVPTFTWERDGDDFRLLSFNTAAETITEGGAKSLVGMHASRLYGADSEIIADMRVCISAQKEVQRELLYTMRSTGERKYIRAYFVYIPPDQVQIHSVDLTAIKEVEEQLRQAQFNLAQKVAERTAELENTNDQLTLERETLKRKNLLQQELLDQIDQSKRAVAFQIQTNIERIVMPLFEHMQGKVDARSAEYVEMIRKSLMEITSPLVSRLEQKFRHLTPQEIQICSMIRRGYSSKEIAGIRNCSPQTVLKQRKTIRRKLGLANTEANLATFLASISVDSMTIQE